MYVSLDRGTDVEVTLFPVLTPTSSKQQALAPRRSRNPTTDLGDPSLGDTSASDTRVAQQPALSIRLSLPTAYLHSYWTPCFNVVLCSPPLPEIQRPISYRLHFAHFTRKGASNTKTAF